MPLRLHIDIGPGLTFGELYLFADQARSAGIRPDALVTQHTEDNLGNDVGVHQFSADLGNITELVLPVLIPGDEAPRYAELLGKHLCQETDRNEEKELWRLHARLYSLDPDDETPDGPGRQ